MAMTGGDWASLIAGLGGAAATAYVANKNGKRNAANDEAALDQNEHQDVRDVALKESLADPFRHQRSQYQNLTAIDMLRQFGSGGPRVTPPANVAPYTGQVRQGFKPSSSLMGSLDALENSIRGGNTAPTMTDPANFGRTSAVNINAATGQPGQPGGGVSAPRAGGMENRDPMSYLPAQVDRRNEGAGGVWAEAVKDAERGSVGGPYGAAGGFVGGAIKGAFTKNAKTAMTDVTLEQAQQVLDQVYQSALGRHASPEEVQSQLAGQGWKPGDRWVGERGLLSVINEIQNSIEARHRGAVAA